MSQAADGQETTMGVADELSRSTPRTVHASITGAARFAAVPRNNCPPYICLIGARKR
jgi:hypothetical protein